MIISENVDTDLNTAVGYPQVQGHLSDRAAALGWNYFFYNLVPLIIVQQYKMILEHS